jgi:hypothetical protein
MERKSIRQRSNDRSYQDEAFALLLARFDRVDRDNKDILEKFATHVKDDLAVASTVARHGTYWSLLIGLGTPLILGVIAWFKGLFD